MFEKEHFTQLPNACQVYYNTLLYMQLERNYMIGYAILVVFLIYFHQGALNLNTIDLSSRALRMIDI